MLFNTSKCKVMHIGKSQKKIHIIWIISSLKKSLKRKIWVSWLVIILKSLSSVNQHVPKQWEFWELSTVLLCSDIWILRYVSTSHWLDLILNTVQQRGPLTTAKTKNWSKRVQRFTRMIPDLKDLPYEQRLAKTKLWSLEDRRTRADLIKVYKIIHGLSTVRFSTFLNSVIMKEQEDTLWSYIKNVLWRILGSTSFRTGLLTSRTH